MESSMRWLSKSQMNTYLQCPMKWKYQYIDKLKSKGSPAMWRGIKVHSNIEKFYKNVDVINKQIIPKGDLGELGQFQKFQERRIQSCVDENGEVNLKYFAPLEQELKVADEGLHLRGFIDAVYINPKDDGHIIIDWETGKYRPENFSGYRFELAVYAELYRLQTGITPMYWGIYFVDADKLFFEPVKAVSIKAMYKKVQKVRDGIDAEDYTCKSGFLCKWCDFNKECPEWK